MHCQEKSDVEAPAPTPALAEARETVVALTRQAGKVQQECGLDILPGEFVRSVLKWGLTEVQTLPLLAVCNVCYGVRIFCTYVMLRHFVSPTMTSWDELLVNAQFAINSAWQESVQNTPFLPQLQEVTLTAP